MCRTIPYHPLWITHKSDQKKGRGQFLTEVPNSVTRVDNGADDTDDTDDTIDLLPPRFRHPGQQTRFHISYSLARSDNGWLYQSRHSYISTFATTICHVPLIARGRELFPVLPRYAVAFRGQPGTWHASDKGEDRARNSTPIICERVYRPTSPACFEPGDIRGIHVGFGFHPLRSRGDLKCGPDR